MHQSSHRILRWTDDDRPYTKDFQDLFCTLIVAVPLKMHRVRLQKRYHTFTTGDAIDHLGNLRFTQTNSRPSPQDPSVTVTTRIATTFSMVPHMARYLCSKFLSARFIESVEGKSEFNSTDSVWQLTPKGISLLQSFTHRNGVTVQHVYDVLYSARNTMHLLVLERNPETDEIDRDRATMEVIFKRFVGLEGPNTKTSGTGSDTESINDSPNGLMGVKINKEKRINNKVIGQVFNGKNTIDWLMSCSTLVDEREAHDVASLFIQYGLIEIIQDDRNAPASMSFPATKDAWFGITEEGKVLAKWSSSRKNGSPRDSPPALAAQKDSNSSRMLVILTTPSLRLIFRQFLIETHCEENLIFYCEVKDFLGKWNSLGLKYHDEPPTDLVRETLAGAYDLYNAYLAPGSPCELNIDHSLRNALVSRMTRFELPESELLTNVNQVIKLYEGAQRSVFKLMASDSVPKFVRDPKYAQALQENHIETLPPNGITHMVTVPTAA